MLDHDIVSCEAGCQMIAKIKSMLYVKITAE